VPSSRTDDRLFCTQHRHIVLRTDSPLSSTGLNGIRHLSTISICIIFIILRSLPPKILMLQREVITETERQPSLRPFSSCCPRQAMRIKKMLPRNYLQHDVFMVNIEYCFILYHPRIASVCSVHVNLLLIGRRGLDGQWIIPLAIIFALSSYI
jgi:hypothetical protein